MLQYVVVWICYFSLVCLGGADNWHTKYVPNLNLSEIICKICVNFPVASSTPSCSDWIIFTMFYYSRTKTKLDEKWWKNIKTYKWTDTSKELLIETLSDENIKNEILGFELNNITEN